MSSSIGIQQPILYHPCSPEFTKAHVIVKIVSILQNKKELTMENWKQNAQWNLDKLLHF